MQLNNTQSPHFNIVFEESSKLNRRIFFSFLLFEIYVLMVVASTSDLQLLVPNSKVNLPLINFQIPLFGFYIVAPVFMVALHFHLLFNLSQHALLFSLGNREPNSFIGGLLVYPFLFNFLSKFHEKQVNYRLLRFILFMTLYFFPAGLILSIQWKFSKYHSLPMTLWHFFLVIIDTLLIAFYWPSINEQKLTDKAPEKWSDFWDLCLSPLLRSLGKLVLVITPFILVIAVIFISYNLIIHWIFNPMNVLDLDLGIVINLRIWEHQRLVTWVLPIIISSSILVSYFLVLILRLRKILSSGFMKNVWMIFYETILFVPLWIILKFLIKCSTAPYSLLECIKSEFRGKSLSTLVGKDLNLSAVFPTVVIASSCMNLLIVALIVSKLFIDIYAPIDLIGYDINPSLRIPEQTLVSERPSDTII